MLCRNSQCFQIWPACRGDQHASGLLLVGFPFGVHAVWHMAAMVPAPLLSAQEAIVKLGWDIAR